MIFWTLRPRTRSAAGFAAKSRLRGSICSPVGSPATELPRKRNFRSKEGCIGIGSKPGELDALIRKEYARWLRVVQTGNIKVE